MGEKNTSRWFYNFDKKEFWAVVIFAIVAIAFAIWNIYTVVDLNSSLAEDRAFYDMAKGVIDSGLYDGVYNQYGTAYPDAYSPYDVKSALAELDAYFGFVDAVSIAYTISCSALIIAAVAMIIRLRISFKLMMGAYIITIAVICIFDIWGMVSYNLDISPAALGIRVVIAGSLLKSLWRYNLMAYEDVKSDNGWVSVSPAAGGVPMPAVKELNSDFDSFVAQISANNPMESVEAPKADTGMAAVVPAGVAVPTERDKMFVPTDVAPSVQPVMPLADASARRADVGLMTGEVVTPLDRPMIPVDMMEDEAMPDISLSQAASKPADAYTAPTAPAQPVQSAPDVSKGIWFCSKCGSLNENANFCNSCGSPKG